MSFTRRCVLCLKTTGNHWLWSCVFIALGAAIAVLLLAYSLTQLSYDRQIPGSENIFRIAVDFGAPGSGTIQRAATIPGQFLLDIEKRLSNISLKTGFLSVGTSHLFSTDGNYDGAFSESRYFYVDSLFAKIFPLEARYGSLDLALKSPNSAIVTPRFAKKYFGREDVIGEVLLRGTGENPNLDQYEIRAVIDPAEYRSHIAYDFLLTAVLPNSLSMYTYVKTPSGTTAHELEKDISEDLVARFGEETTANLAIVVQPLHDIYLNSHRANELSSGPNKRSIWAILGIGVLILLMAGVSYIYLLKEIFSKMSRLTTQKYVCGASPASVGKENFAVVTLLTALVVSLVAGVAQLGVLLMSQGEFGKYYDDSGFYMGVVVLTLAASFVLLNLVVVLVPAVIGVFKMRNHSHPIDRTSGSLVESSRLLILLIVVSISGLSFWEIEAYKSQMVNTSYEGTVVVDDAWSLSSESNFSVFREALNIEGIQTVSRASSLPGRNPFKIGFRDARTDQVVALPHFMVSEEESLIFKGTLIEGELLDTRKHNAREHAVVNEIFAEQYLGQPWTGQTIQLQRSVNGVLVVDDVQVVGVVTDTWQDTKYTRNGPNVITLPENYRSAGKVLIDIEDPQQVSVIESVWTEYSTMRPFMASFGDQLLDKLYESERAASHLYSIVALALFVLSIFGTWIFAVARHRALLQTMSIHRLFESSKVRIYLKVFQKDILIVLGLGILNIPISLIVYRSLTSTDPQILSSFYVCLFAGAVSLSLVVLTVAISVISFRSAVSSPVVLNIS